VLPTLAREAVENHLRGGGRLAAPPLDDYLRRPAGVFVTIRGRDGALRGCRGTIVPRRENLVEETRAAALSAAFQDPRFEPVTADELDELTCEVSVLNPAEPVSSAAELDPRRYGLIISTPDGRRGLMLPAVEGIETVTEQIQATCRKARIDPREPMSFARFTTDKFTEDGT
jgi:AmmeMemoRadiSam system protein A